MKSAKASRILVDTVEGFLAVFPAEAAEAGSGRIHKHEIGHVEQAVVIVDDRIGRGRSVGIVGGDDALRPECSHVKPHGRGTGTAVIEKRDWARRAFVVGLEVGNVEHAGFRAFVLGIGVGILRDVVPALGMHDSVPAYAS